MVVVQYHNVWDATLYDSLGITKEKVEGWIVAATGVRGRATNSSGVTAKKCIQGMLAAHTAGHHVGPGGPCSSEHKLLHRSADHLRLRGRGCGI